jgi:hypothetical protein
MSHERKADDESKAVRSRTAEGETLNKEAAGNDGPRASRRRFTKGLAVAFIAAPALAARAQTPPKAAEPKAPPNPQPTPAQQPQAPPKPSPLAEAYTEAARLRFGQHLSAEQLESVKRDMEGNVRTADRLRAFKLKNGDEPDFVFSA